MSDGLVVPDALAAGEQVRMLPVDHFQIISAAHFHLLRLFLEQDLAAQLVKHDGVHLGGRLVLRVLCSVEVAPKKRGGWGG